MQIRRHTLPLPATQGRGRLCVDPGAGRRGVPNDEQHAHVLPDPRGAPRRRAARRATSSLDGQGGMARREWSSISYTWDRPLPYDTGGPKRPPESPIYAQD